MKQCPLCSSQARFASRDPLDTSWHVDCPLCGEYIFPDSSNIHHILTDGGDRRHLVRGHLREMSLRRGAKLVSLTEESVAAIADAAPRDVLEKVDRLLLNLASKTPVPGEPAQIGERDYPLGYCKDSKEFGYLLDYLREQKLLKGETVTVPGWGHVRELRKAAGDSTQAFVAMWFSDETKDAYEQGIKPAIEEAGYRPLRIDKKEHSNRIDDEIILEINRSRFLVADFTGHRPGVYFEAGYALGQKKPVIWTCRKDQLTKAHFDTRQYNHIDWETPTELQERLYKRIAVLVG